MSFFLVTDNKCKAETARDIWTELYGTAEIGQLTPEVFLVTTVAFRKRPIPRIETAKGVAFAFGTLFSPAGFGTNALAGEPDLFDFSASTADRLYGHYTLVIASGGVVRIVTDPVGLINVHWAVTENGFIATNDPVLAGGLCGNPTLNASSTWQFVMNLTNTGDKTLFKGVSRLRFGCELWIAGGHLEVHVLYAYLPLRLTYEEYCERIENYFDLVSRYPGVVAADISAGHDSRFVAACAKKSIPGLVGLTNTNLFDHGTDAVTSPAVAAAIGIPLVCIPRDEEPAFDAPQLLHGLTLGRDVILSKAMLELNQKKYLHHDLLLGGYGGEIVRGKYCKYQTIGDFVEGYYQGPLLRAWGGKEASRQLKETLEAQYMQGWITTPEHMCNWLYAMDKMRIWGGSCVAGKLIFGDRLHPFMDWHLMRPVFAMNYADLKGAHLMKRLMERYTPGIARIPINAGHRILVETDPGRMYWMKRWAVNMYLVCEKIWKKVLKPLGFGTQRDFNRIYRMHPRNRIDAEFQAAAGATIDALEKSGRADWVSQFATVHLAMERAKTICEKETRRVKEALHE